jgi:hypothetical protein
LDELRAALELTTEEELQQLTELLFSRKFNPLDYVQTPAPIDVQSRDREAWLDAVEQRFRYLAADGLTVLRGRTEQVTYSRSISAFNGPRGEAFTGRPTASSDSAGTASNCGV